MKFLNVEQIKRLRPENTASLFISILSNWKYSFTKHSRKQANKKEHLLFSSFALNAVYVALKPL